MAESTLRSVDANVVQRRLRDRLAELEAEMFTPLSSDYQFTRATTATESNIPTTLVLALSTTSSSGQLLAATTALEDRMNVAMGLINQIVYALQSNEFAT